MLRSPVTFRRPLAAILGGLLVFAALLQPVAAKEQRLHGQGRLFKVTAAGIDPSYVFGTMHVSDPEVLRLPGPVARALDDCSRLVLELVFTPAVETRLAESMVLTDGRTLSNIIGPELFSRLLRRAALYGIGATEANQFRPWAIALLLSFPKEEFDRSVAGSTVLDRALQQTADSRGMPVYGLESLEEQIAAFSDMPERDQIDNLRLTIDLNPQIDALFAEMKAAYLAGDLTKLHAMSLSMLSDKDMRLADEFEKRFIEVRNRRMANRLARHVKQGGAFVAVGALHLSGENGILHLLEIRGYKVSKAN